jgi:CheY-like chemotaxis protein
MATDIEHFRQRLGGARVLLAEDEVISRTVVSEILRTVGIEVVAVGNGREAVETVARERFDLVLMDVVMPELNGYDATREIRRTTPSDELPILAMTAYAGDDDRQQMTESGMNDHIAKPVDLDTLLIVLVRWIGKDPA